MEMFGLPSDERTKLRSLLVKLVGGSANKKGNGRGYGAAKAVKAKDHE